MSRLNPEYGDAATLYGREHPQTSVMLAICLLCPNGTDHDGRPYDQRRWARTVLRVMGDPTLRDRVAYHMMEIRRRARLHDA